MINRIPFPHRIYDGQFGSIIDECSAEFDQITEASWQKTDYRAANGTLVEKKDWINFSQCAALPHLNELYKRLSSSTFIEMLEIEAWIRRLRFDTKGGGLHRVRPGGLLAQHIDFNVSDDGNWRRVNALLYLNDCQGGRLGLWNDDGSIEVSIEPKKGRLVVFECSEHSWHGHPTPLPEGQIRKSVAAYYFTKEKPADAAAPHETIFRVQY